MFTTAGAARATASAYEAGAPAFGTERAVLAGSSAGARAPSRSQSGPSVVTMNNIPRHTVTVWAKTNHKRCIDERGRYEPGFHAATRRMARQHPTGQAVQRLLPQRPAS